MKITSHVLPPLAWHIFQIIIDVLCLVVSVYVLNQSHRHWLLFDVLNATITMSFKFKEEFWISFNLEDLFYDNHIVALELSLLASNNRREVCGVWNGFLSFFKKYETNKSHNILSFMSNPRFKSLRLVSSLNSQEHDVSIVEEYDQQSLFPMLLKC
jgi:hypothetical protein